MAAPRTAAAAVLVAASFSATVGKPAGENRLQRTCVEEERFTRDSAALAGPSLKWAQDTKKIYLTVGMGCKSDVKFAPTEDTFVLSCKDASKKAQKYSVMLREDIIVADSACKSVRGDEVGAPLCEYCPGPDAQTLVQLACLDLPLSLIYFSCVLSAGVHAAQETRALLGPLAARPE